MLLYYITDRTQFPGEQTARLREKVAEAIRCGVDYIQLREKDLPPRQLEDLASQLRTEDRQLRSAFLINSRVDVALAVEADGVHLRSHDISPGEVRRIWQLSCDSRPIIGVSCHTEAEVAAAATQHADFAVFAPVFAKKDSPSPPAGLDALRRVCRYNIPVLALGGVTLDNARQCIDAGAAGIAGIRLFQQNKIEDVVRRLRG